jgi:multiple sugar transport system permease protein
VGIPVLRRREALRADAATGRTRSVARPDAPVGRAARRRALGADLGIGVLIALGLLFAGAPYLLAAWWSLLPSSEITKYPPNLLTLNLTTENYVKAWVFGGMGKYLRTTVLFAVLATSLELLISALASYAFGRLRYPGRDFFFSLVVATLMVPGAVTLIPSFFVVLHVPLVGGNDALGRGGIGLYNSMGGLILPGAFGAGSIFLLRQFFRTLPQDMEDAARVDGAGEWTIFWRVVLPLSGPGLATVGVLNFTSNWNAYLWPLVISADDGLYTVSVGLQALRTIEMLTGTVPPAAIAASVMAVVPIVVVFVFGQRYFQRGIALSGIK